MSSRWKRVFKLEFTSRNIALSFYLLCLIVGIYICRDKATGADIFVSNNDVSSNNHDNDSQQWNNGPRNINDSILWISNTSSSSSSSFSLTASAGNASIPDDDHHQHQIHSTATITRATTKIISPQEESIAASIDSTPMINTNVRPYLIFHIGPPKTGTTTIQCGLRKHEEELATYDNYYYLGVECYGRAIRKTKRYMSTAVLFDLHTTGEEDITKTEHFGPFWRHMEEHRQRGHNVIISIEGMARRIYPTDTVVKHMKRAFGDWNLHVVITYRHYFQWLLSFYYQSQQEKRNRDLWDFDVETFHSFARRHLQMVPMRKGKREIKYYSLSEGEHMSIRSIQNLSKNFTNDNIKVFNMHQDGDLLSNFICQMLPPSPEKEPNATTNIKTTTSTCQNITKALSEESDTSMRQLVSGRLDGKLLATAAFKRGYLDKYYDKNDIDSLFQKYSFERSLNELLDLVGENYIMKYYTCIPKQLKKQLLDASIYFEKQMIQLTNMTNVSKNNTNNNTDHVELMMTMMAAKKEKQHEILFEKADKKNKFCQIDVDKILNDPIWVDAIDKVASKHSERKLRMFRKKGQ